MIPHLDKTPQIVLLGNHEGDRWESMNRYVEMLHDALRERRWYVRVVRPPYFFGRIPGWQGLKKWLRYIDKYAVFPLYLRIQTRDADVIHICDQSNAPYLFIVQAAKVVVTCHDLFAIRSARGDPTLPPTSWNGRVLQWIILRGLERARSVVVVSEATAADLKATNGDARRAVTYIPNPLNWAYCPSDEQSVAETLGECGIKSHETYLLHVGGDGWYKNRAGVIEIFRQLKADPAFGSLKLVMAGKPLPQALLQVCEDNGLSDSVISAPSVDNQTLKNLYSGARALLFPSLAEGFGWPILEAQACGCPVITSNVRPMTDVGGDAAIYIDPSDITDATKRVDEYLRSPRDLREAGFENVRRFNKEAIVGRYLDVYLTVGGRQLSYDGLVPFSRHGATERSEGRRGQGHENKQV